MDEEKKRKGYDKKTVIVVALVIVFAVLSATLIGSLAGDETNYKGTYKSLDDKRNTVAELMAASAAAATGISLLPGDAGTPIAEKLADLSGYFLFILSAIFIEKWLLTTMGLFAFRIIIPICCIIFVIGYLRKNRSVKAMGIKIAVFAFVMFLVVPVSVFLSDNIEESFDESMQQTVEEANEESNAIKENVKNDGDTSGLEEFLGKLTGGVKEELQKFEDMFGRFIESIAKLIVTTCVIPIAVILFMLWFLKLVFGVTLNVPADQMGGVIRKGRKLLPRRR